MCHCSMTISTMVAGAHGATMTVRIAGRSGAATRMSMREVSSARQSSSSSMPVVSKGTVSFGTTAPIPLIAAIGVSAVGK